MSYDIRIVDASALRFLQRLSPRIVRTLERRMARGAEETAREMKREAPKASSLLTNSIKADQLEPLRWWVGPHVRHALYVHRGRRPGGKMPPLQRILDWVRIVLRPPANKRRETAFLVARKIRNRGIKPNQFALRTHATMEPIIQRQVAGDIRQLIRSLSGAGR